MKAADKNGSSVETKARIRETVQGEEPGGFVAQILARELSL